jgi:hypothetical protein
MGKTYRYQGEDKFSKFVKSNNNKKVKNTFIKKKKGKSSFNIEEIE